MHPPLPLLNSFTVSSFLVYPRYLDVTQAVQVLESASRDRRVWWHFSGFPEGRPEKREKTRQEKRKIFVEKLIKKSIKKIIKKLWAECVQTSSFVISSSLSTMLLFSFFPPFRPVCFFMVGLAHLASFCRRCFLARLCSRRNMAISRSINPWSVLVVFFRTSANLVVQSKASTFRVF